MILNSPSSDVLISSVVSYVTLDASSTLETKSLAATLVFGRTIKSFVTTTGSLLSRTLI